MFPEHDRPPIPCLPRARTDEPALRENAWVLARRVVPKQAKAAYTVPMVVHATVARGPTLDRRFYVTGFGQKSGTG
jgi:hypothetical protein